MFKKSISFRHSCIASEFFILLGCTLSACTYFFSSNRFPSIGTTREDCFLTGRFFSENLVLLDAIFPKTGDQRAQGEHHGYETAPLQGHLHVGRCEMRGLKDLHYRFRNLVYPDFHPDKRKYHAVLQFPEKRHGNRSSHLQIHLQSRPTGHGNCDALKAKVLFDFFYF